MREIEREEFRQDQLHKAFESEENKKMMIYKGDRPILYRKSNKKTKEKIKQYEHRLKILNKKIDIEEKEIESFKSQYQKIFDVLNKLETKQQNL